MWYQLAWEPLMRGLGVQGLHFSHHGCLSNVPEVPETVLAPDLTEPGSWQDRKNITK